MKRFKNVLSVLLLALLPVALNAASTQTIGGNLNSAGDLKILYLVDGRMNIQRHNGTVYQNQVFGGSAKGSLLYDGTSTYAYGYFSGAGSKSLQSLSTSVSGSTGRITAIWTAGTLSYVHTMTYVDGDPFYRSQWSITNTGQSSLTDLRLFHGQDTFLAGSDAGAGFWVAGNNTIGVERNASGTLQRQLLQGLSAPFAYESRNYNQMRIAVNAKALTNSIDTNVNTDNGYALEWRMASLAPGATWTVQTSEKFLVAPSGVLAVTAPTVFDATPNSTIQIPFVVTNVSGATVNTVNLNVASSVNGWNASIASPNGSFSLAAGTSQTVQVSVTVPSGAIPGDRSNITLTADNNSGFNFSDVAVAMVPNSPPTVPIDSDATANSVAENAANGDVVNITAQSTDSDVSQTLTYTLTNDASGRFAINASTGVVTVADASLISFENATSHTITVRVSDGIDSSFTNFTIAVINVNQAPTNIALSASVVVENVAVGTTVGTLSSTDPDTGETFAYTLVNGTSDSGNAFFAINGNTLHTAAAVDFEAHSSFTIRVRSTDAGNLFFERVFTITVTDVIENLAPTDIALTPASVVETSAIGTVVGILSTFDADAGDSHTYALVDGNGDVDNAAFSLVGNLVKTNAVFDFEAKSSYSIRVRSTDAGSLWFEKMLTISVSNVIEVPAFGSLSVSPQVVATGVTVTFTIAANDPEGGTPTISIDYGDGTIGSSLTHAYSTAGTFVTTVTVSNAAFSVTQQVSIAVHSADFNKDGFVGPMDTDTDGDGVPNSIEIAMGTSPSNSAESPIFGTKPISFRMEKPKTMFATKFGDMIDFKGVLHVPAGLDPAGQTLVIDAGGNVRKFVLGSKSAFENDDLSFQILAKLNPNLAKEARFKLKITGALLENMIKNAPKDEQGRPIQLTAHILFNGSLLMQSKALLYRK